MEEFEIKAANLFNHMAEEYDDILDLWYSWLFMRIQYFISLDIKSNSKIYNCLDVGCGTGFQSFLFSELGIDVTGVDISSGLINKAKQKVINSDTNILKSKFEFINKLHKQTLDNIKLYNPSRKKGKIDFMLASATDLPFENESFDSINCIGSVLSFIDDYDKVLKEFRRILKPNGVLFFEFENKYNLDIIWPIIDSITPFSLGYDNSFSASFSNAFTQTKNHIKVNYPFSMHNEEIDIKIWLFNCNSFLNEWRSLGFEIENTRSIHSITNFIPSTKLDDSNPNILKVNLFKFLSNIENMICDKYPFNRFGCSTYVKMRKTQHNRVDGPTSQN